MSIEHRLEDLDPDVHTVVLDAPGFTDLLGEDCYFATDEDAVAHLEEGSGTVDEA
jgi:hypothetical protein